MQIIERYYGMLEIHRPRRREVRAAGAAILAEIGLGETDRIKPRVLSNQIIRRIDDHQAQLINRTRHGQMLIPGADALRPRARAGRLRGARRQRGREGGPHQHPRGRAFGSMGRIYLGGEERDIDVGWRAAVAAIEGLEGREAKA